MFRRGKTVKVVRRGRSRPAIFLANIGCLVLLRQCRAVYEERIIDRVHTVKCT